MKQATVLDLSLGAHFSPDTDLTTVYELTDQSDGTQSAKARRIVFFANGEWHHAPKAHEENWNPYACVTLRRVVITVVNE